MTIKGFCILAIVAILGLSCSVGLQGGNGIEVVGNSTDNSVTMSLDGSVVRGVLTDSGNATGSDNWLSMLGAGNVTISASGSTITISCNSGGGVGGNATYALDSDKLDGQHGAYYLTTTGTAADSTLFYGFTALQWTSAMDAIAAAATSADSDKLDGIHGSGYLTTAGTAADSDKLDGQHGSHYAVSGSGVTGIVAGTGISVSANTGNVTVTNISPDTQLSSKVLSFSRILSAAGGDVSYAGFGFKPTSLEVYACTSVTGTAAWGMSDSAKGGLCTSVYWGTAPVYCSYSYFLLIGSSGSAYQTAVVKSYDDDGFTLTWARQNSPSGTSTLQFKAMR